MAKVEFDSERHYLTVLDGGHPKLVYSAPLLRLPSGQSSVPRVEWDGTSLSLDIPTTPESYPLVLAFSVVGQKPAAGPRSLASLFPSLKLREGGEVHDSASSSSSSSSSEDELDRGKTQPKRKPAAAVKPADESSSSSEDDGDEEKRSGRKVAFFLFLLFFFFFGGFYSI